MQIFQDKGTTFFNDGAAKSDVVGFLDHAQEMIRYHAPRGRDTSETLYGAYAPPPDNPALPIYPGVLYRYRFIPQQFILQSFSLE